MLTACKIKHDFLTFSSSRRPRRGKFRKPGRCLFQLWRISLGFAEFSNLLVLPMYLGLTAQRLAVMAVGGGEWAFPRSCGPFLLEASTVFSTLISGVPSLHHLKQNSDLAASGWRPRKKT